MEKPKEEQNQTNEQNHIVLSPQTNNATRKEDQNIPEELPVLALKDTVVFPHMVTALGVTTKDELKLLDSVLAGNRYLALALQKDENLKKIKPSDLYHYATGAVVLQMLRMPDGTARMLVQGLTRVHLEEFTQEEPYMKARVEIIEDVLEKDVETEALTRNLSDQFTHMITMTPNLPEELKIAVVNVEDPGRLADMIASHLNISIKEKQDTLETLNVKERMQKVTSLISKEMEVLELASKIQTQVKSEMEKGQREYYLRQQMKAIQDELGEGDERAVEIKELKKKIAEAKLPPEAQKESERELARLERMPPAAAEYTVSRTFLDWIVALPWAITTEDNLDINEAQKVLDEDHYNLQKVKERIIEYLAVRKMKNDMKGPILCFVGPPGTGKTSLGKSIARALGRKFIRMSLGGVRDEAEIRGHRRTYVGALPGRVIQGLRKAGSNNPIFMLDEVDKLGADFRGDPSAALLEVLDPEQNFAFSDHYLDVAFDLSKVMFITTANILDPIPPALRDRMEVLELPGYSDEEKLSIAKQFVLPKQLKEHGLTDEHLTIDDDAIKLILSDYTREAGLRNLEREIAHVCRKAAKEIASGKETSVRATAERVREFLGPQKFFPEVAERTAEPGVATGLAWTRVGGEILFIESTLMPGNGRLTLTGQLGDVMKESAQAAMSYVRTRAEKLCIQLNDFTKYDFHVHVPAGAIPKDGPSAGVTMTICLISLLKQKPVHPYLAMTGEITLRGQVLPVGGIKEKVLAARRAGITTVILPKKNENDLIEVPENVKEAMTFHFVEQLDEMLPLVFKPEDLEEEAPAPPPESTEEEAKELVKAV